MRCDATAAVLERSGQAARFRAHSSEGVPLRSLWKRGLFENGLCSHECSLSAAAQRATATSRHAETAAAG
jgi:hypothetical protein